MPITKLVRCGLAAASFVSLLSAGAPAAAADWRVAPSAKDLRRAYPEEALAKGVSGRVWIRCGVVDDGRLDACRVAEETPPGYGFGAAALSLVAKLRLNRPWGEVAGSVTFPIDFGARGEALSPFPPITTFVPRSSI